MRFDGVARVSRAAAQLAFFATVALDVYQGNAIWYVYIDSLFLNALPVPMLATGLCWRVFFHLFDSKTPLDAPRRPKTAPRRPQDGPRRLQEAPRRPQGSENGGKMEEKRSQVGIKMEFNFD